MKSRTAFVSNSSSTSYLIALPDDFNPEEFVTEENINRIKESLPNYQKNYLKDLPKLLKDLKYLIQEGVVIRSYGTGDEDAEVDQYALSMLLKQFLVLDYEGGPDNDTFIALIKKGIPTPKGPSQQELSVRRFSGNGDVLCSFACPFVKVVDIVTAYCSLYKQTLRYEETGNNDLCYRCQECRKES